MSAVATTTTTVPAAFKIVDSSIPDYFAKLPKSPLANPSDKKVAIPAAVPFIP